MLIEFKFETGYVPGTLRPARLCIESCFLNENYKTKQSNISRNLKYKLMFYVVLLLTARWGFFSVGFATSSVESMSVNTGHCGFPACLQQLPSTAKSNVYDETLSLNLLFSYRRVFLMLNTSVFPYNRHNISKFVRDCACMFQHSNNKKNDSQFSFLKYQLRPLLLAQILL